MFRSVSYPDLMENDQYASVPFKMETLSEPTTYDAEGRMVKVDDLDPEAQQISDEFHKQYAS
jgi:hypothetical protein